MSGVLSDGLVRALEDLGRRSPIPVVVMVDVPPLPPYVDLTAWFLCSEALANVTKHARATRAEIRGAMDSGVLVLTVTDDGIGGADAEGAGIRGLVDRVGATGGELRVVSPAGGGTTLEARIPRYGSGQLPARWNGLTTSGVGLTLPGTWAKVNVSLNRLHAKVCSSPLSKRNVTSPSSTAYVPTTCVGT